ncbi:MAG: hypothetical protein GOMPHAMPRED_005152 [Gomphillus americanus]|uniref:Nephrocystin 3-like N-terminal domain-containing protein n=1 Tax=Gomphillus americanus TaxID=1940652 RepID=A0A8H3FR98_9LECA|nr:MAG: hypothetical protein GOMPHAMPRED_005152 [Gomphillus americanus]
MTEHSGNHIDKGSLPTPSSETRERLAATQADTDKLAVVQDYFLQSLSFPQMHDREHEVNKVSDKTYAWLLTDESNFPSWLEDRNEQIYWINGKPGCGKSTLMRFVSQQNFTMQRLKVWSGSRPLTTASYYFWTSGTQDQRSQAGLLRSLLHQLLTQHKELMPLSVPALWLSVWEMSTKDRIKHSVVWDLESLLLALRMFLGEAVKTMSVVFFVDGLDEFDGKHDQIITIFNDLVRDSGGFLKLCISSRSWPVFEHAYKTKPQFKLQDFTLPDITQFVSKTLSREHNLRAVARDLPKQYSELVSSLVQKADGVFLWASLAVKYLCKVSHNMSAPDTSKLEIHQYLKKVIKVAEKLPNELDDLFHWLVFLQGKDPAIVGKIAMLLKSREQVAEFTGDQTTAIISVWDIAIATMHIPTGNVLQLWIDDTESEIEQVPSSVIGQGVDLLQTTLDNTAPGLLVHHENPDADEEGGNEDLTSEQQLARRKMTYAHRTIKDWLDQTETQQKLAKAVREQSRSEGSNNQQTWLPHLANLGICQASRRLPILRPRKGRSINDIWPYIVLSLTHARMAEQELSKLEINDSSAMYQKYISYTTSINDLLTWYWRKSPGKLDDSWSRNSFGTYEERLRMIFNKPWLSICTRFGLKTYIKVQLLQLKTWQSRGETPLLSHAVEFLISRKSTIYPLSDPALVDMLLEWEFRTDEEYMFAKRRLTPWLYLLETLQQAERRGWIVESAQAPDRVRAWVEVCNLFVRSGADLNAYTVGWEKDPAIQARALLVMLKEKHDLVELMI